MVTAVFATPDPQQAACYTLRGMRSVGVAKIEPPGSQAVSIALLANTPDEVMLTRFEGRLYSFDAAGFEPELGPNGRDIAEYISPRPVPIDPDQVEEFNSAAELMMKRGVQIVTKAPGVTDQQFFKSFTAPDSQNVKHGYAPMVAAGTAIWLNDATDINPSETFRTAIDKALVHETTSRLMRWRSASAQSNQLSTQAISAVSEPPQLPPRLNLTCLRK
ncbi:MAG: hypothetical protein AAF213_02975 [Pseudomonadota bacterium]